jgi:membrane-associated phospholipid phosphatase
MSSLKYNDEGLDISGTTIQGARVISRLTPAPLINLYVGMIMVYTSPIGLGPVLNPAMALLVLIPGMVILPVIPIIYAAWRGHTDLDVSDRETRAKFFAFSLFCYSLVYVIFSLLECLILAVLSAAYFTVTAGVMIATLKSKVSVHGAGVGGPGTALLIVYGWIAWPVIILWIAVIWSRIVLKQHSLKQAFAGVMLGILITLPTYWFLYLWP